MLCSAIKFLVFLFLKIQMPNRVMRKMCLLCFTGCFNSLAQSSVFPAAITSHWDYIYVDDLQGNDNLLSRHENVGEVFIAFVEKDLF